MKKKKLYGQKYNSIEISIRVPEGLEDVSKYPDLFDRLYESKEGEPTWTKEDLEKLASRNFIRVFQAVETASVKIIRDR